MNRSLLEEESYCDDGCTEKEDVVTSELVKAMIAQRKRVVIWSISVNCWR
jgi:hypothetical protein